MITFVMLDALSVLNSSDFKHEFSALEKMLKKSTTQPNRLYDNQYQLFGDLFDIADDASKAVASVEQSIKGHRDRWSCVASPVMISPNRDHLDLAQIAGFNISENEAKDFCAEFNDYFKDDGFSFSFDTPDKWYCHCDNDFDVSLAPPTLIDGGNIAPHIPQGKEGAQWRKIFNETQMLLHHSLTNRQRNQAGKPEINSLWFWGGGRLSAKTDAMKLSVFSNQLYVKGLCHLSGSAHRDLTEYLNVDQVKEPILIVTHSEHENWRNWESQFFKPALSALQQRKVKSVIFYFNLEESLVVKKSDFLRFWKSNSIK